MSINEIFELVCDNIPEDWEIRIGMRHEEASIELVDPEGDEEGGDDFCDDDLTTEEMILQRLNHARRSDGLSAVDLRGEPDPLGGEYDG